MRCVWQLGALALACCGSAAAATTAWDEAVAGDLSNDGLAPTAIVFAPGANRVAGTTGNAGQGVDRDYFSFTVPPGAVWSSLRLVSGSVSGSASFIGLQAGPQLTVTPSGGGVERLLGFTHYGNDLIGSDILPGAVFGFSGPLPSGSYSVWIQETGGPAAYVFEFGLEAANVGDVPTLPEWGLLLLGALLCAAMWRRQVHTTA